MKREVRRASNTCATANLCTTNCTWTDSLEHSHYTAISFEFDKKCVSLCATHRFTAVLTRILQRTLSSAR